MAWASALPADDFTDEQRSWWAVQPVADPAVPGEGHPIDAFIERKRTEAKLSAAPAADAQEFVRRAYFDLHGLPPTPAQVDAFALAYQDDADKAVSDLIDELLASPRYGERWAQHWLDVVRYAESDGYREDRFRPDAHRYRDYVVRAFNDDKPYDQFVREQLAADEIAPDDPSVLEATGFLRLGIYEWNQRNAEMQRELMVDEITGITGEAFLGLGIACARCHDHKFDPLLQRDYFALQAFLSSTTWPRDRKLGTPQQLEAHAEWGARAAPIRAEIDALLEAERAKVGDKQVGTFPPNVQEIYWKPQAEKTSYEKQITMLVQRQVDRERSKVDAGKTLAKEAEKLARYKELKAKLDALEKEEPKLPMAFVSTDTGAQPAMTYIDHKPANEAVDPGYPALLGVPAPVVEPKSSTTGRRSVLAKWIASTDNPFAARVYVNRIWQGHFGTGLVATPNDFGTLGEPPSHPELLDWLATQFVEGGWRTKPLHRLIMTSAAYRQTARREPGDFESSADNANRLLWRFPPMRLSAEQVRDAMLAVSGELAHRIDGGISVKGTTAFRSLYVEKHRNAPDEVLQCFDAPTGFDSAPERQRTTTPTQALLLSNNEWPAARARAFAKRLEKGDPIRHAYRLAWGREAAPEEVQAARTFIDAQTAEHENRKPPEPRHRFPNETGLRSVTQNFANPAGNDPGAHALWLQPSSRFERLELPSVDEGEEFSLKAFVQLDAIHKDASVRTLVSRWSGNTSDRGWSLGVTGEKSRYGPRQLIVQLVGENPGGDLEYEVVVSRIRVPLGRPITVGAEIAGGVVKFQLKQLNSLPIELEVEHNIVRGFRNPKRMLLIGGRDSKANTHLWDGQLAQLDIRSQGGDEVLHVRFSDGGIGEEPIPGSRWRRAPVAVAKRDPALDAMADFCHALLSSNEFLYLH